MKLLSILVASIWAVAAAAQGITIGFPPKGQDVSPGQQLTIQVIKNVPWFLHTSSLGNLILTNVLDAGFHSIDNRGWIGNRVHAMPCGHFSSRLFTRRTRYHSVQWSFQSPDKWAIFLREFYGDDSVWCPNGWRIDRFRSLFLVRGEFDTYDFFFFKKKYTDRGAIF